MENLFSQRSKSSQNSTDKSKKIQNLLNNWGWEVLKQIQLKDISKSNLWQKEKPDNINIIKKTGGSSIIFAIMGFLCLMSFWFIMGEGLLSWYIEANTSGEITQFLSLCEEFKIKEAFSLLDKGLIKETVRINLYHLFLWILYFSRIT